MGGLITSASPSRGEEFEVVYYSQFVTGPMIYNGYLEELYDYTKSAAEWGKNAGYGSLVMNNDGTATLFGDTSAPYTYFDGKYDSWHAWFTDTWVYLPDPAAYPGKGFDYCVAASSSELTNLKEYFLHVGSIDGVWKVGFAPGSSFQVVPGNLTTNLGGEGWHRIRHSFRSTTGIDPKLEVTISVYDCVSVTPLVTETIGTDFAISSVGENYYGWFTFIDIPDGLTISDVVRGRFCELDPGAALADLIGLVSSINLANGIANSLDAKLDHAETAYESEKANKYSVMTTALGSFLSAVTQQASNNKIPASHAQTLIEHADEILMCVERK